MREGQCMASLPFPDKWVLGGLPIGLPFQASFKSATIPAPLMASWAPASLASSVPGVSFDNSVGPRAKSTLPISASPYLPIPFFWCGVEILDEGILKLP